MREYLLGHGKWRASFLKAPRDDSAELIVVFCDLESDLSRPYSLRLTREGHRHNEVRKTVGQHVAAHSAKSASVLHRPRVQLPSASILHLPRLHPVHARHTSELDG